MIWRILKKSMSVGGWIVGDSSSVRSTAGSGRAYTTFSGPNLDESMSGEGSRVCSGTSMRWRFSSLSGISQKAKLGLLEAFSR